MQLAKEVLNSKRMTEEKKQSQTNRPPRGEKSRGRGGKGRGPRRGRRPKREPREFEQKILDLARVTRVTKGGKRMRFRTCLVIGDKKGRVGVGVAKGADVAISVEKAFRQAKKNLINVPLVNETIPHEIKMKFGAAHVMLRPAPEGTGLKSGGAARLVLELAGVPNAVSKILGSNNKVNNARATVAALKNLRSGEVKKGVDKKQKEVKKEVGNKQKEVKKPVVEEGNSKLTAKN